MLSLGTIANQDEPKWRNIWHLAKLRDRLKKISMPLFRREPAHANDREFIREAEFLANRDDLFRRRLVERLHRVVLNLNAVGFNTSSGEPVCKRTAYSNDSKCTAQRPSVELRISAIFEVNRVYP